MIPGFPGFVELDLTKQEYYFMMDWAFGSDWLHKPPHEMADEWNRRHTAIFTIFGNDNFTQTMINITRAWKHRQNYPMCDLGDKCQISKK